MTHTPLGLRLKELRAERGLSLRDAARETGVDRDTIREIELGERHPFPRTLARLAAGYGIPLRELLELEEPVLASPKVKAPQESGHQEIRAGLGEEGEEGLAPEIKEDFDAAFWRFVADARKAGIADEVIRARLRENTEKLGV